MLFPLTYQPTFKNIVLSSASGAYSPCEPSIAVSQSDPNNIVAGIILDRIVYTRDGGKSWRDQNVLSPNGLFGDPTVISDRNGKFYYFTLSGGKQTSSWLDRINVQTSVTGGETWNLTDGFGLDLPTQQDKQWATTHPSKPYVYATWTRFDKYGAKEPTFHSNIMFSMSSDAGKSWSISKVISDLPGDCIDDDGTTEGAVPAVGTDGTIYVTWASQGVIFFDRSKDNGKTWLKHDLPIARQYGGWTMDVPGISRCNGMPVLMIDNSNGPNKGVLYLVFSDKRKSPEDADIIFMSSRDGGDSWTKPTTINADNSGKYQFLPWLAVDQTSGFLYVVYYDRRNFPDNQTDVILAYSKDGGKTFREEKISETSFVPESSAFFGDYNCISAHKGVIAPIWTRMDNRRTSVLTAVIRQADLDKHAAGLF